MVNRRDAGASPTFTPEEVWADWAGWTLLRELCTDRCRRLTVVSAHPDDDVLAVSMLVQHLVDLGAELEFVIVTDGENSHPNSPTLETSELARQRRTETRAALVELGLSHRPVHRLGLRDSGLSAQSAQLRVALAPLLADADVVLAPWSQDGHPDHEEVGRACCDVRRVGQRLWEYPVWAWHWATPSAACVPWERARIFVGSVAQLDRKRSAIGAFRTQIAPLSDDPADVAVLPTEVLAHFYRPHEVVFT